MTDYRVTVKVQNNNILGRIYESGYSSVSDFCRRNENISQSVLGEIINMKRPVFTNKGEFIYTIKRTANALGCLPEALFSDAQLYAEIETNVKTYEVSEDEMRFMLVNQQDQRTPEQLVYEGEMKDLIMQALETLTPREKKVITLRMGLDGKNESTLEEVAQVFGVNRARIRQIEDKALRKLRHPTRAEPLRDFLEEAV